MEKLSEEISLIKQIELLAKEKYPRFVNGGDFERLAMDNGYKASNAGRRCRELETGKDSNGTPIRKALFKNPDPTLKSVEYRWIPDLTPKDFDLPMSAFEKKDEFKPIFRNPNVRVQGFVVIRKSLGI